MERWFQPTREGDARRATLMGIFYAATSFAIAEVLPFGDASPATWMLAGLIFTAIIYAWLRRQHGHTKA